VRASDVWRACQRSKRRRVSGLPALKRDILVSPTCDVCGCTTYILAPDWGMAASFDVRARLRMKERRAQDNLEESHCCLAPDWPLPLLEQQSTERSLRSSHQALASASMAKCTNLPARSQCSKLRTTYWEVPAMAWKGRAQLTNLRPFEHLQVLAVFSESSSFSQPGIRHFSYPNADQRTSTPKLRNPQQALSSNSVLIRLPSLLPVSLGLLNRITGLDDTPANNHYVAPHQADQLSRRVVLLPLSIALNLCIFVF